MLSSLSVLAVVVVFVLWEFPEARKALRHLALHWREVVKGPFQEISHEIIRFGVWRLLGQMVIILVAVGLVIMFYIILPTL